MEKFSTNQENNKESIERPFLADAREGGFEIENEDILSTIGVLEDEYIEKIKVFPESERVQALLDNGILCHALPEKHWSFRWGRPMVFVKINGATIPFYRSKSGTDGKEKGTWYPFFGFGDNWILKGSLSQLENGYDIPPLKKAMNILNTTLTYDQKIDTIYNQESMAGEIAGKLYRERDNKEFDPSKLVKDHPIIGSKGTFISPCRINRELFGYGDEEMDWSDEYIKLPSLGEKMLSFLKEYKKDEWKDFHW